MVIFAPRRYGKSSLIWRVRQELVKRKVLVAQVDLMTTPTKERLAEKLAKAIHEEIASALFRAKDRLQVFSGLRITPTITVDPQDGSVGFGFAAGRRSEDVDATLERLLQLPARLAAERNRRVALVLDEFQEIVEIDPHLPRLLRSTFQEQPDVAHVYLGSKRHMMERIFNDRNEPFWRSAKQVELGVIAPPLFRTHIERQFQRTGRTMDPGVPDALLAVTRGHPYATQELCYFLWEETPDGEEAGPGRLDAALEDVLRSENAHFDLIWDRAAKGQRLVLQALAAERGRPLSGGYRSRHGLPGPSSVQRALEALTREELVLRENGEYRIAEPFLAEWLATR
ncbi:MAG: AAA family ATPase [Thermoleophilaceae bacterium]